MMRFPFEAAPDDVVSAPERYVDAVFASLASEFLVMPKGDGFLDYSTFAVGYEVLKKASDGFTRLERSAILSAVLQCPTALIVLRSILGFTPSEWAHITLSRTGLDIPQNAARTIDRNIRAHPCGALKSGPTTLNRVKALVETACSLIEEGCPIVSADKLHRLSKADSLEGLSSVRQLADLGVPYALLLYERFLGRPFAGHRDSVSELVGDGLESAIEEQLVLAGVTYRKTKRAERLAGFDQAPDFIVPDEFLPHVVIEAKVTEDDGTARDKVTRIIRLCQMSEQRLREGKAGYQVIACLAGRGFGVRREDMRQLILHTKGKVFTPMTLDKLVDHSAFSDFRTRRTDNARNLTAR